MKMTMKQINRYLFPLLILIAVFLAFNRPKTFTKEQRLIIRQSDSVMYVTVWPEDSAILRTPCVDFTKAELKSKDLQTLMAKMLATVRAPQHDGVGIAGPQVGIGKRIIWLQRLDKEGGPFEALHGRHRLVCPSRDAQAAEGYRPRLHRRHLPARVRPSGRPPVHRPGRYGVCIHRLGSGKTGIRLFQARLVAAAVAFPLPAVPFR